MNTAEEMAAEEMVKTVRDIIQQELSTRGQTVLCQVVAKTDDKHYNVYVVPDESEIIQNVLNTTRLDFKEGDYVYIYKINNQLNNSFIMSAVNPYASSEAPRVYHEAVQVDPEPATVIYEASTKRWFLQINDDSLYNQLCTDDSDVIVAIYREHSKKQVFRLNTGVERPYDDPHDIHYQNRLQYTMAGSLGPYGGDLPEHIESINLGHTIKRKIDVTHIVQEYMYHDNYVLHESEFATYETYQHEGAWWKRFGLCLYSGAHGKYWHTPHDKLYVVYVHIEPGDGDPDPSLTQIDAQRGIINLYQ